MFLTRAIFRDMGALQALDIDLRKNVNEFKSAILVGTNGSGKTSVLSSVADALFELAGAHYVDAIPGQAIVQRPWFRIVGAATIKAGAKGSAVVLELMHGDHRLIYKEKAGTLDPKSIGNTISDDLHPYIQWPTEGNVKELPVTPELSKAIIEDGAYVFFPSSRSELPHWINRETVSPDFNLDLRFDTRLSKHLFVERGFKSLQPWILDIILEARLDRTGISVAQSLQIAQMSSQGVIDLLSAGALNDLVRSQLAEIKLQEINKILRKVMMNDRCSFVWAGRKAYSKLTIDIGDGKKTSLYRLYFIWTINFVIYILDTTSIWRSGAWAREKRFEHKWTLLNR